MLGFIIITLFLAVIRLLFPSIARDKRQGRYAGEVREKAKKERITDSVKVTSQSTLRRMQLSHFFNADGSLKKNRIVGVRDYDESFPDSQPQQLDAALRYGVKPVASRTDAEKQPLLRHEEAEQQRTLSCPARGHTASGHSTQLHGQPADERSTLEQTSGIKCAENEGRRGETPAAQSQCNGKQLPSVWYDIRHRL